MNRRRLKAMIIKEGWQVIRDPSALLVAFILPPLLLFFFAFGVSLDVKNVQVGLVLESDGPLARDLAAAYQATPYMQVTPARHRKTFERALLTGAGCYRHCHDYYRYAADGDGDCPRMGAGHHGSPDVHACY